MNARRDPIPAVIFYFVCVLLFPAMLIGYMLWVGQAFTGRTSGVSGTAQGPLSAPGYSTISGLDAMSSASVGHGAARRLAARLTARVGPDAARASRECYVPQAFRYPFEGEVQNQAPDRQTFYDSAVDRYLAGVAQFVILGAGFDTRAFRLPNEMQVRSFEVDAPKTLAIKREALHQAGINRAGSRLSGQTSRRRTG